MEAYCLGIQETVPEGARAVPWLQVLNGFFSWIWELL